MHVGGAGERLSLLLLTGLAGEPEVQFAANRATIQQIVDGMTDCCGGVADLTWSVHGPVATEVGTQTGLAGSKERERLVRQAIEAARLYLSLAPWLFSNPLFRRPVSRVYLTIHSPLKCPNAGTVDHGQIQIRHVKDARPAYSIGHSFSNRKGRGGRMRANDVPETALVVDKGPP